MKTRIFYTTTEGVSTSLDVDRDISGGITAKRVLAEHLDAPLVDAEHGEREDIDSRLRHGGIDPDSVTVTPLP